MIAVATPKTAAFTADDAQLATWAKALGHPARIAILRLLAEQGSCLCSEVVEELPLAQATVSQHLRALKEVGLIRGETDGPRSCYCLAPETLGRLHEALGRLFTAVHCTCGRCG
jgi:DNA-binding transcriptional ArsR family regulator